MNRALWKKAVGETRWLLVLSALGLVAICFVRVAILRWIEMSTFAGVFEKLFEKFGQFSAVPLSHLLTYDGRIAMVYNEPMLVLIVAAFAIARGSDVVSGEIGRGTMEFVLAQPVGRLQVLLSQAVVGIAGVAVLCAATWVGTAIGVAVISAKETKPPPSLPIPGTKFSVPLPFLPPDPEPVYVPLRHHVNANTFTPAAVNLFSLGVFLLALTTLMSAWDQYRWRTIGIVVAVCIGMTLLKVFGMAAPELEWMQSFSFFTPYSPEWSVYVNVRAPSQLWNWQVEIPADHRSGFSPLSNNVILLSLAAACYFVAGVIFTRRDLPAPL